MVRVKTKEETVTGELVQFVGGIGRVYAVIKSEDGRFRAFSLDENRVEKVSTLNLLHLLKKRFDI